MKENEEAKIPGNHGNDEFILERENASHFHNGTFEYLPTKKGRRVTPEEDANNVVSHAKEIARKFYPAIVDRIAESVSKMKEVLGCWGVTFNVARKNISVSIKLTRESLVNETPHIAKATHDTEHEISSFCKSLVSINS